MVMKKSYLIFLLINLGLILGIATYFLVISPHRSGSATPTATDQTTPIPVSQNAATDPSQTGGRSVSTSRQFQLETDLAQANNNQQKGETVKTLADFTPLANTAATLKTNRGDIKLILYPDKAPLTVTNFLTLAQDGYFDDLKFHRVIANFMAQTGDPYSKDPKYKDLVGTGGPGYRIEDEFVPTLTHDAAGVLSMANTGQPHTGGSQFFITFEATPWLDGKHAVFGKVADDASLQVLKTIQQDDVIFSITVE